MSHGVLHRLGFNHSLIHPAIILTETAPKIAKGAKDMTKRHPTAIRRSRIVYIRIHLELILER